MDDITKNIIINPNPVADFTIDDECEGIEVSPTNVTTGASTYAWDFGDGTTSAQQDPIHIFASNKIYNVRLLATSVEGCTDDALRQVNIYNSPVVGTSKDAEIGKGLPIYLSASGGLDYEWSPSIWLDDAFSATPKARPDVTTEFKVVITDINGCMDTGYVLITAIDDYKVFPINTMTPNGDGVNDKFFIKNLYNYPNNTLVILDQWGREVYQKEGYAGEWDGTQNGKELPGRTYYYILYFGDGTDKVYKGSVTIVRAL
ncbi:MAG: gliding motility-associated-like protein [Bacteroidia bacterium]|jgi:gliding motility-associated-like protein